MVKELAMQWVNGSMGQWELGYFSPDIGMIKRKRNTKRTVLLLYTYTVKRHTIFFIDMSKLLFWGYGVRFDKSRLLRAGI
jgi:hypothetical protein